MTRDTYRDEIVRIADVPEDGLHIVAKTFERCTIRGPAILCIMGDTQMTDCTIGVEDMTIDSVLWPWPRIGGRAMLGVLGVNRCLFKDCTTESIGFTGPPEVLNAIATMIGRRT